MNTKEKIKQVKSNIHIDEKLLNKYRNVKDIFENVESILNYKNNIVRIYDIPDLKCFELESIKIEPLKKVAYKIFNSYHLSNTFINDENKIIVTKSGINESIEKIYNTRTQRNLLKEHLLVFANLGKIIKNAILVNQVIERKNRIDIYSWNYYLCKLFINDIPYVLEFDVRSMIDGQNQYRIHRLELK